MTVHCFASPGKTVLDGGAAVTIIDYDAGLLCIKPGQGNGCVYPLFTGRVTGDPATDFLRRRSEMAGTVKLLGPVDEAAGSTQLRLRFGGLLDRVRTVVTPTLERFGMRFSAQEVRVSVEKDHPQQDRLLLLAEQNEKYYRDDPLLRRMDPLGLLHIAGGVVTAVESAKESVRYIYMKDEYPGNCRSFNVSQQ